MKSWAIAFARRMFFWDLVLICAAFLVVAFSAAYLVGLISLDAPAEYLENAIIISTKLWLTGNNPYDLEHQPVFISVYGPGYHWLVYPFARVWGPTYAVHRSISALFIVFAVVCLGWGLCRSGVSPVLSLAFASLWFIHLAKGYSSLARPDSVGLLLFFLSVLIPQMSAFSTLSLGVSVALGVLALITKPYFVFGSLCLPIYLFLFRSKRLGLLLLAGETVAIVLVLLVLDRLLPYYILNCYALYVDAVERSIGHLLHWVRIYLRDNWGVILLGMCAAYAYARERSKGRSLSSGGGFMHRCFDFRNPGAALTDFRPQAMTFMLVCGAGNMLLLMGLHPGNDLLYYDQMISPFLYWSVAMGVKSISCPRGIISFLLVGTLVIWPPSWRWWPESDPEPWRELKKLIETHASVLASPPIAHLLWNEGRPIYDTGWTAGGGNGASLISAIRGEPIKRKAKDFRDGLSSKCKRREFDLLLLSNGQTPLISKQIIDSHYEAVKSIHLIFPHYPKRLEVKVMRPKSSP